MQISRIFGPAVKGKVKCTRIWDFILENTLGADKENGTPLKIKWLSQNVWNLEISDGKLSSGIGLWNLWNYLHFSLCNFAYFRSNLKHEIKKCIEGNFLNRLQQIFLWGMKRIEMKELLKMTEYLNCLK